MKAKHRYYLTISIGILVLAFLIFQTLSTPLGFENWLIVGLFFALIVFTTASGVPLGGGTVSLLPMTTIAAFLVLGTLPTAWAVFWGAIVSQIIRQRFGPKLGLPRSSSRIISIAMAAANASMQTISILVGSIVFKWVGGKIPFSGFNLHTLTSCNHSTPTTQANFKSL